MNVTALLPKGWPSPRGYTNGFRIGGGCDLVFVAGMIGWDREGRLVAEDLIGQFDQALANVLSVLAEAGGEASHVVRMTVFVVDIDAYRRSVRALGDVWRQRMGRHYPAMALVEVSALVEPGAAVEIEATAAIPASLPSHQPS